MSMYSCPACACCSRCDLVRCSRSALFFALSVPHELSRPEFFVRVLLAYCPLVPIRRRKRCGVAVVNAHAVHHRSADARGVGRDGLGDLRHLLEELGVLGHGLVDLRLVPGDSGPRRGPVRVHEGRRRRRKGRRSSSGRLAAACWGDVVRGWTRRATTTTRASSLGSVRAARGPGPPFVVPAPR